MKKIYALLSAMLFTAAVASAQYYVIPHTYGPGNPGGLNNDPEFPIGGGAATGWTTILPGSQIAPALSPATAIPFAFQFNGQAVTHYKAGSIGLVTFDTSALASTLTIAAAPLPNAAIPNNSVVLWGLQGTGSNDLIITKTFGTAPNRQHWISYSSYAPAPPAGSTCWNYISVVLEETSNKIYIVDQRNNPSCTPSFVHGIQINATTAIALPTNPTPAINSSDALPAGNNYFEFIYGTQAPVAARIASITTPRTGYLNDPVTIAGGLFNAGSQAITSCNLNYTINNGATQTVALSGLNVASGTVFNYSSSTLWTPTTSGAFTLRVWCSAINGGTVNSDTSNATINVLPAAMGNLLVFEHFTNASCGPCAAQNPAFVALLKSNALKATSIKYHVSWPGVDPMYSANTADPTARVNYYGVTGVPDVFLGNAAGLVSVSPSQVTQALIDQNAVATAPFEYNINTSVTGNVLTVSGNVNNPGNVTGNLVLQLAVVEDPVKYATPPGTNGETEFPSTLRKLLPSATGTTLSGASTPFSYTYTIPTGQVKENLFVVAFVQNNTNKQVYKGGKIKNGFSLNTVTSVAEPVAIVNSLNVYPNPARGEARISFNSNQNGQARLRMFNLNGQEVMSRIINLNEGENNHRLDLDGLAKGLYLVELSGDNGHSTVRLSVD